MPRAIHRRARTLGNGITPGGGRGAYVNFLTPGILLLAVVGAANTTAISVAKDMTEGIIARFKPCASGDPPCSPATWSAA